MKNFLKNRYVRWCIIPFYVAISLFLANYSDEFEVDPNVKTKNEVF